MSGMFGSPEGFRTYDRDQAELGLIASQTQHQQALTGLNRAQTDTMLRKQKSDEDLLKLVAGQAPAAGPGGQSVDPDTVLQQMSRAASIYASVGRFDEAGKLIKDATQAQQNLAGAKASGALEATRELKANVDRMRLLQERLATVTSPQRHAEVLTQLMADPIIGSQIPAWLKTYNPAAIRGFVAGSPAQIAQAELAIKNADAARKQGDSQSLRNLRQVSAEVKKRLATVAEERNERLGKTGGGKDSGVGMPSSSEVQAMRQELKAAGYAADADTAGLQAQTLAEEARLLVKRNPGLTPSEARARVVAESQARGELTEGFFSGGQFKGQVGSLSKPIAHSVVKSAADLKIGSYYRDDDGSIKKFTGKGFEVVGPAAKVPVERALPAGLLDDEEDDE